MDRFIDYQKITLSKVDNHLKSNMDRFIVAATTVYIPVSNI